jgi:hypothetical protein
MAHGETDTVLARDIYLGTTEAELSARSVLDRLLAVIDQKVLFPRRGIATLQPDRLVLTGWDDAMGEISLRPDQISAITNDETEHSRLLTGGIRRWGAPLRLFLDTDEVIYLLLNRRWFSERTDNIEWTARLTRWWEADPVL